MSLRPASASFPAIMGAALAAIGRQQALDRVPGVMGEQVDAKASTVTVTYDAQRTTIPAVTRAITEAGYPAKPKPKGG